jgi:cation diffusion facilitator CzcD-associated flavoprotein CzcO
MSLPYSITGRRGANLLDTIVSSASFAASGANGSFLGVVTRGFPNLFTMLGANTGLGHNSVVWMAECQANYAIDCVRRMREARVRASEVQLVVVRWRQSSKTRTDSGSIYSIYVFNHDCKKKCGKAAVSPPY